MDILKFLIAVNGAAQLQADNGHFLGELSSNPHDYNSIINPHTYGSSYSYSSIQNPDSPYGGTCGMYSPYNFNCINPPGIIYQGQLVLVVTQNPDLQTYGLPIVDPDLMLGVYLQRAMTRHEIMTRHETTAMQLEAVNQAFQAVNNLVAY